MSEFNWCHGPKCHTHHTQDRIRGVKGSKVLRTKKIKMSNYYNNMYQYFCSQRCYTDFFKKHIQQIVAIAPRTEALETPIDVVKKPTTDWRGNPYMQTKIITVDNNGG